MSSMSPDPALTDEQVVRVLGCLAETVDEIETVTLGGEDVTTLGAVRRWLSERRSDADFVHYVNNTGPYARTR